MADTEDIAPAAPGRSSKRVAAGHSEDLEAQVQQLQEDLRNITRTLTRMGEHQVDQVKSAAKAQASSMLHRGQEAVGGAQDEFTQIEKQLKDTIRERPLTAVAGALALGFVLAALTRGS